MYSRYPNRSIWCTNTWKSVLVTDAVICADPSLTLCPPRPRVTPQALAWPRLLSPLCSPRTTTCSWAGLFTISSTRSDRPSPGSPATTRGMKSATVPAVSPATAPTCSRPASSSLSESSSLRFPLCVYSWCVYVNTPAVFDIFWRKQPSLKYCCVSLKGTENILVWSDVVCVFVFCSCSFHCSRVCDTVLMKKISQTCFHFLYPLFSFFEFDSPHISIF